MQLKISRSAWALLFVLPPILFIAACGSVPKTSIVLPPLDGPLASVNDSLYWRVLDHCLSPNGTLSYAALVSDTNLTAYLDQIARVRTDAFGSRSGLLAFWINTHNAYVLDLIRSNPARSIDDISGFRYANVVMVGDTTYSLDDIEHSMLEHQFREPRTFFALYDGTRSSPALRHEPYAGDRLSDQLDNQLHGFLADSTKNYLDRRSNTLYLSNIFEEFRSTLEEMAGEPLSTLVRDFGPPGIASWIARHPSPTILYLSYDNTIDYSDFPESHAPTNQRAYTPARRISGGIR